MSMRAKVTTKPVNLERFHEAVGRALLALRECGALDVMRQLQYWHMGRRRLVIEWESGPYGYEIAQLLQQLAHDPLQSSTLDPDQFRVLRMNPSCEHEPELAEAEGGSTRAYIEICGVEVELRALSPIGYNTAFCVVIPEALGRS